MKNISVYKFENSSFKTEDDVKRWATYFGSFGLFLFSLLFFIEAKADTFADVATKQGFGNRVEELRTFSKLEGYSTRETNPKDKYNGPIIDVLHHTHAYWGQLRKFLRKKGRNKPLIDSENMIQMTKELGVIHSITSEPPRIKGLYGDPIKFSKKYKSFSALCSPHFVAYQHRGKFDEAINLLKQIELNLKAGNCIGIGEVGVQHYNKSEKYYHLSDDKHKQKDISIPLDNVFLHKALKLSDKYKVPILIHLEPRHSVRNIDNVEEVKKWYKDICKRYINSKIVLVHNGMFEPNHLADLFETCPNVYSSFKIMRPSWTYYWKFNDLHIVNNMEPLFAERWAKLLEKYPDRMMLGSNIFLRKMKTAKTKNTYRKIINNVRLMVGSLDKEAQKKIMYDTPKKLFNLEL